MSSQKIIRINILVLHGPNLNLLGEREPEVYGSMTLADLNRQLAAYARKKFSKKTGAISCALRFKQSNHEGALLDCLHANRHWADGVVFNPAAMTHYSYALRDAVAALAYLGVPTIEVHLSDIKKREKFRRTSVIAPVCLDQISGHGWESYTRGIDKLATDFCKVGRKGVRDGR